MIEAVKKFNVGGVEAGGRFFIISGPCVIEDEKSCMDAAAGIKRVCEKTLTPLIFKSSYSKANRSSLESYAGPGLKKGLAILRRVRKDLDIPVLSDVHCREEIAECSETLDAIQVPAFLCRQTPLLLEAAASGLPVNIKKGQFLSPAEMANVVRKIESGGNSRIMLTERGTCFGYNNLVVDMRALPLMRSFGYPVIFDATHSVQLPGGAGSSSSGDRGYIFPLARAACAAGCDGLFLEVHPGPDRALCDGPNMLPLAMLEDLILQVKSVIDALKPPGVS